MVRCNAVLLVQKTPIIRCAIEQISAKSPQNISSRQGTGRGSQKWVDSLRVYVIGGHGGNGHPKYGGVGGKGGDVIIKCSSQNDSKRKKSKYRMAQDPPLKSLYDVFHRQFDHDSSKQRVKAKQGEDAHRSKLIGHVGYDNILKVCSVLVKFTKRFCSDETKAMLFSIR